MRLPNRTNLKRPILATSLACLMATGALANPPKVDFDPVLEATGMNIATADGNLNSSMQQNGLLDAAEMALVAAVLNDPDYDQSAAGGASHADVLAAYQQALASARMDVRLLKAKYPTAADMVAGYVMLGDEGSFAAIDAMMRMFGAPLQGDYMLARGLGRYFGPDGDADGDGVSNRIEYIAFIAEGRDAYVKAALDPALKPTDDQILAATHVAAPAVERKTVGIVLYPGFEVLDVYGPLEMWSYVKEFKVVLISETAGPVKSGQGTTTIADYSFETAPKLDILMVPGGFGTFRELENTALMDFLRERNTQTEVTSSVCTGSALLARAGLLKGQRATSNKRFFSLATDQDADVEWVVKARWVESDKFITSSGVSAGTDMALGLIARLYGKERAEKIASSVEYEWHMDATDDPFARFAKE